ncbi:MAG: hypothetical protein KC912_17770 [Proteobacteria bacterium]|nr:hypothetical protein [Pseudomonadota bacterium]
MLSLLFTIASASTIAVLPLERGSAPEAYDGLGHALAAMITTDLTKVDGLTVVERARLDDILGELELSTTDFVDKRTAQQLGRGLAADHVVTGTWSVVGESLVIDARIVRVETGKIAKADRAKGTIDDFVTVEKAVVEALIEDLEVTLSGAERRKIIGSAPTESLDAFSQYGAGLVHTLEGDDDEARAAFTAALVADPDFAEAKAAVERLGAAVEAVTERREAARLDAAADRYERAITESVDERTRKKGFRHDAGSLAEWVLRLDALERIGEHCVRYEEMRAYLEREGLPTSRPEHLTQETLRRAIALGKFEDRPGWEDAFVDPPNGNPYALLPSEWSLPLSGLMAPVRSPDHFLWEFYSLAGSPSQVEDKAGMVSSLHACFDGDEEVAELRRIHSSLQGDPGLAHDFDSDHGFTVSDALDAHLASTRVLHQGLDAEAEALSAAWLARVEPGSLDEFYANNMSARIVSSGEAWIRHQEALKREAREAELRSVKRMGMSEEELLGVARAYAETNTELIEVEGPFCSSLAETRKSAAEHKLEFIAKRQAEGHDTTHNIDDLWWVVASARAVGCLKGVPAELDSIEAIYAVTDAVQIPDKPNEACRSQLKTYVSSYQNSGARMDPEAFPGPAAMYALVTLDEWFRLKTMGCLPKD